MLQYGLHEVTDTRNVYFQEPPGYRYLSGSHPGDHQSSKNKAVIYNFESLSICFRSIYVAYALKIKLRNKLEFCNAFSQCKYCFQNANVKKSTYYINGIANNGVAACI